MRYAETSSYKGLLRKHASNEIIFPYKDRLSSAHIILKANCWNFGKKTGTFQGTNEK